MSTQPGNGASPGKDRKARTDCDGAGNGGRGALAAELAVAELSWAWQAGFVDSMRAMLAVDQLLIKQARGRGETTCVAVEITDDGLCRGASAGDSGAWMISQRSPGPDSLYLCNLLILQR